MTRKRFTKKLMSLEISRNRANAYAADARERGIPYHDYYNPARVSFIVKDSFERMGASVKSFQRAVKKLSESFDKLARSVKENGN